MDPRTSAVFFLKMALKLELLAPRTHQGAERSLAVAAMAKPVS